MAKNSKKRKPQHHNPAKDAVSPAAAPESKPKAPFSPVGILALLIMAAGIVIASVYNKGLGCMISVIGATVNLINASVRKTQTVSTLVLYLVYVALVFVYWFR